MPNDAGPEQPLSDAYARLEWADRHVAALKRAINDLHRTARIDGLRAEFPLELMFIATDAAHSIRAALDYLYAALARENGKPETRESFPINRTQKDFLKRDIRDISPEAKAFISRLTPYLGGWNVLWALNEIDRVAKHHRLIPAGHAPPISEFARTANGGADLFVIPIPSFAEIPPFKGKPALALLVEMRQAVSKILDDAKAQFFADDSCTKAKEP